MNIKDVENLAQLARIQLSQEEKEGLLSDMEGILEYVNVINKVELENSKPVHELYNVWREDKEEPRAFSKELIMDQFPEEQDGFLKVPKIL